MVLLVALALAAPLSSSGSRLDESRLEARLLAPCCYIQTLDAHQSPLATQLRAEIHERLTRGESASSIEAEIVGRYGDRVRAVPRGFSVDAMGMWMFAGVGTFGLLWLAWWITRLKRRPRSVAPRAAATAEESVWESRLDEELDRLG